MFDHFEFLAPFYDRFIRPKSPDKLIELLKLPTAGSILDVGGGTGRISQGLRGMAKHILIADASLGMLQQAQTKGGLVTVQSLSEKLPFPSNSFERVLMVDALHHVIHQDRSIDEMWRVLRPGGVAVIEEPDIRTAIIKLVAVAEKLALMRSRFLAPATIAGLFPENSHTQIHVEGYNAWVVIEKGAVGSD